MNTARLPDGIPPQVVARRAVASLRQQLSGSVAQCEDAVALTYADGMPVPAPLATWAACTWNGQSLFVLFEGRFTSLRLVPEGTPRDPETGKTQRLWELSDVFEFFVVPDAREQSAYREFQVAPDARWFDAAISGAGEARRADHGWDSRSTFESLVTSGSVKVWKAGMQIPWTSLGVEPRNGLALGANFYRATGRFHGDELLAWSPTGYGERAFHRTDRYGLIKLS